MAILNSIRKKTAVLILIIALALFAFVLSDLINTSGFSQDKTINAIGKVGNKEIDRKEFAQSVENYIQQTQGRATTMQAVKQIWDSKVQELALEEEFETLGIEVGREQIVNKLAETLAGNPNFSNEEGVFDEGVMTEFLANLKATQPQQYAQWQRYEKSVENQVRKEIYLNMIKAGSSATQLEAKQEYMFQNDNVDIQFVRIPFDKAEKKEVTEAEIKAYITKYPKEFEQEEQRDIQYVLFEDKASEMDINNTKKTIEELIVGLKTTEDTKSFINTNSDEVYNAPFKFERQLSTDNKEKLLALEIGDVFGPYMANNMWKATKLVETKLMPDSVKVSHILISTKGPKALESPEESKKLADSLLSVIKKNPSKLGELAEEYSADTGSAQKGGDLGWNLYGNFVPSFNEAVFNNDPNHIDLVETQYGYHVIHIKEHSQKGTMYKFADLILKIKPSEATLNEVYKNAGNFYLDAEDKDFTEVAKTNSYEVKPVLGVKTLDEQIPGLQNQRQIVTWAFDEETSVGDIKQFDIDKGYVVVQLNKKIKAGTQSPQQASAKVTPILEKEKQSKEIIAQITTKDINAIASQFSVQTQTAKAVNRSSPVLPGAGQEPIVVGAAFGLEAGSTSNPIEGEKGIYVIKLLQKTEAPTIASYKDTALKETQKRMRKLQNPNNTIFKSLTDSKEIEDNRKVVY